MSGIQGASRQAVCEFIQNVFAVPISTGGLQKLIDRVSEALLPVHQAIGDSVLRAAVMRPSRSPWTPTTTGFRTSTSERFQSWMRSVKPVTTRNLSATKKNKGLRPKSYPLDFTGAEGQNRTADTGIFSRKSAWLKKSIISTC